MRRLFGSISKCLQTVASLTIGAPSQRGLHTFEAAAKMLNVHLGMVTKEAAIEVYRKHKANEVKLVSMLDQNARLTCAMLSIVAKKYCLYPNMYWHPIHSDEENIVYWPELETQKSSNIKA